MSVVRIYRVSFTIVFRDRPSIQMMALIDARNESDAVAESVKRLKDPILVRVVARFTGWRSVRATETETVVSEWSQHVFARAKHDSKRKREQQ